MKRLNKFLSLFLIFVMVLSFVPAMAYADGEDEEGNGETLPEGFTVSFAPTSGSGEMEPVTGVSGEYILPECGFTAPENMIFLGWALTEGGEAIESPITVESDIELFALWADDPTIIIMTWSELQTALAAGESIVLPSDVICDDQQLGALVVPEEAEVTLDLNGHTLNRGLTAAEAAVNGNVISVFGKLTVTDSAEGGTVTGGNCAVPGNPEQEMIDCGGIYIAKDARLILEGGTVSGNIGKGTAGTGVKAEGTFVLSGGVISGNKDDNNREINLYLCSGSLITIGADNKAPQSGTLVGISTETEPALDAPVTVAAEGLSDAYADFFASDDPMFKTVIDGGRLLLALNSFRVTFDVQGQGTAPETQDVYAGEKAAAPEDPAAEGYLFKGWFKDSACTSAWDFENDTVTADITLYAKWMENTHTVSFDMQGHGTAIEAAKVNDGEKVTEPTAPAEVGATFAGWYKEAGCRNAWDFGNDTVTADITLYAKWDDLYTMIQGAHGAWIRGTAGGLRFKSDAPFDKFVGVKVDGQFIAADNYIAREGSTAVLLRPEHLTTLPYARHSLAIVSLDGSAYTDFIISETTKCTVSFDVQGIGAAPGAQTVSAGGLIHAPASPYASGYMFKGWFTDKACTAGNAFDFSTPVYADTVLYAKWIKTSRVSAAISGSRYAEFTSAESAMLGAGESYTFSIRVTDSNYYVGRVTVDGVVVSGLKRSGANAYYSFTNNDASKSHIVRFVLYNSKGVPATGDSFKPLLWCSLLALSAAGIAAAAVIYKKKNK